MIYGSNLEEGVAWLLEGGVHSEQHARDLLLEETQLPEIDLSAELARLQECKVGTFFSTGVSELTKRDLSMLLLAAVARSEDSAAQQRKSATGLPDLHLPPGRLQVQPRLLDYLRLRDCPRWFSHQKRCAVKRVAQHSSSECRAGRTAR